MTTDPSITFRGIASSPALEDDILGRIKKLDACCERIVSCHVVVEVGDRRHESGTRYQVRIRLVVPHGEIVIAHNGGLHGTARATRVRRTADMSPELQRAEIAVHQAFDLARRQLQDFQRKRRDLQTAARKRARSAARLQPT